MNERPIDRHESRRHGRSFAISKVSKWIDAWNACYEVVQDQISLDLTQFHLVFERWVPILNWIFQKPIFQLENYTPFFYYCNQQNGPKEIIQLYIENDFNEGGYFVHVILNVHEFNLIHKKYCAELSKANQLLFNEARGTINLSSLLDDERNTAEYFQIMTGWQLLFIHTLHALAHWDLFDKYRHAHYDTHLAMRESPFYKFYCCGDMILRK